MKQEIVKSRFFYRVAESFVPILTWLIITLPIWLSPFRPALTAYFILAFFVYFLYKSVRNTYYLAISYKLMIRGIRTNWYKKLIKTDGYSRLIHYIIITNYRETVGKLTKTINKIKKQRYPKEKINIVLAMEEREGLKAHKRSKILTQKFKSDFGGFHTVFHQLKDNETMGKASNETCAAKFVDKKIKQLKMDMKSVLITVCDADSLLPKDYLACLTYKYLHDAERTFHFYWAPVLLYSNFWQLSLPVRVQSILSSVLRLAFLAQKKDLIQISTYSTNLWLLKQVNFWDVDVIPEDWHIWLQAFFKFGEKVKTLPIYLPIKADAVANQGLWQTFRSRYDQEKRWAWGASDIPYALKRFFETPHISPLIKIRKILLLVETHLFWPTSFFILTLSSSIPPLINPVFKRTVLGFILPKLSSLILTISSVLLIFILYFDHKIREKVNVKTKITHIPLLFIQWYFLPIISFLFSSLPALEAHTRLLLGKKLEYKVTEKI